ncbi:MAG: ABC transporter permease [Bacteroidales bacterium]
MVLRYLIEKELKQFRRNVFLPQMLVIYPLMIMLVFPWAVNMEIKNINLSVVDHDKSPLSSRLTQKASASGYFRQMNVADSYTSALHAVEAGDADIILEIPADFEKTFITSHNAHVLIAANTVDGTKGALGSSYLSSIISDFNRELISGQGGAPPAVSVNISTLNRFNPHQDYKIFMIPALIVIILTLLCGFLPALNIVSEKENGTIEQMNVTPIPKLIFILSKLIPYWVLGLILLSFCILLGKLVYGLFPAGSLLTLYGYTILFILTISGFGLIISNKSQTMQQAMFVMFFFLIVFILMSGLFTPIASMPQWARILTLFNPLSYFITIMRSVYLRGSSFLELLAEGIPLLFFAVLFNLWAFLSYRKNR